jgi:CRISPR-associated protein Cas2
MILISYDIQDDKLRTKFAKYIKRFGHRIQYSVYEINNCNRILDNIVADITNRFLDKFSDVDTILILKLSKTCEIIRMGYAKHEEADVIMV